jgi:hypothetical protein
MIVRRTILAICAVSLCAGPAVAQGNRSSRKANPNKIVCRTESEMGTRLKKAKVCHTLAEWEDMRRQTDRNVERIQAQARATSGG